MSNCPSYVSIGEKIIVISTMFFFPITVSCFQIRSAVTNSLNRQPWASFNHCQPWFQTWQDSPSLMFLPSVPGFTFFSFRQFFHILSIHKLLTDCWICLNGSYENVEYYHNYDDCKTLTRLPCKRWKTCKVAVNWSELVCSPPRRQPPSIQPPRIRIKIGDKLRIQKLNQSTKHHWPTCTPSGSSGEQLELGLLMTLTLIWNIFYWAFVF